MAPVLRCFALEPMDNPELPGSKRRRVVDAREVAGELGKRGLVQPTLSVLNWGQQESPVARPCLKRCSADPEQVASPVVTKRKRMNEDTLSPEVSGTSAEATSRAAAALSSSIVPYCGGPASPLLRPAKKAGPLNISIDLLGTAFVLTELGVLLAELPVRNRPHVFFPEVGTVEVAKICIDSHGSAYIFGEDGRLLTVIHAIRYLEDRSAEHDDIHIEFFGDHAESNHQAAHDIRIGGQPTYCAPDAMVCDAEGFFRFCG